MIRSLFGLCGGAFGSRIDRGGSRTELGARADAAPDALSSSLLAALAPLTAPLALVPPPEGRFFPGERAKAGTGVAVCGADAPLLVLLLAAGAGLAGLAPTVGAAGFAALIGVAAARLLRAFCRASLRVARESFLLTGLARRYTRRRASPSPWGRLGALGMWVSRGATFSRLDRTSHTSIFRVPVFSVDP